MTATKNVTIWCDHDYDPGRPGRPCPAKVVGYTVTGLRAELRGEGWRYIAGHPTVGPGRDLCPDHAAATP